jgi:hypothetical protein
VSKLDAGTRRYGEERKRIDDELLKSLEQALSAYITSKSQP